MAKKSAPARSATDAPLLRVENLKKHFPQFTSSLIRRAAPPVRAVDGISLEVRAGETLGLVDKETTDEYGRNRQ